MLHYVSYFSISLTGLVYNAPVKKSLTGNAFRVSGRLWGDSEGSHSTWTSCWIYSRVAVDLIRHEAHVFAQCVLEHAKIFYITRYTVRWIILHCLLLCDKLQRYSDDWLYLINRRIICSYISKPLQSYYDWYMELKPYTILKHTKHDVANTHTHIYTCIYIYIYDMYT